MTQIRVGEQPPTHNPGPWKVATQNPDVILCSGSGGYQVIDMEAETRGDTWGDQHPINPADVRLMAASPELLAFARDAVHVLGQYTYMHGIGLAQLCDRAQAVIRAATIPTA